MSVLDLLRDMNGCSGGIFIYYSAQAAAGIANWQRIDRKLKPETICRLRKIFPKLNLSKVTFNINATLPPNWFTSANDVAGMTFGYHIYFDRSNIQNTQSGLRLLIHELVHVDQVRRRGNSEAKFACAYGIGYLNAGNYEDNPLEKEARDFVDAHGIPSPCYGGWCISKGGTGKWTKINKSDAKVKDLAFADFTGDGKADVFASWGGYWYISEGGTGGWRAINKSSLTVKDLAFADFTGDGKADIFSWQIK